MEILIIICVTLVAIIAIAGALSTIEKCSFYKWKAHNPEAFRGYDDMEEDQDGRRI